MKSAISEICQFCSENHDSLNCIIYSSVRSRMRVLEERNACFRCLQIGHTPFECPNATSCKLCNKISHHTSICWLNKKSECKNDLTRTTNEVCVFCSRHLNSNTCRNVKTFAKRQIIVRSSYRCVKCIKYHPCMPCDDNVPCRYCHQNDHHKSLCPKNKRLEENYDASPITCVFCDSHKHSGRCRQVVTISERRQIIDSQGRCHKCLRLHKKELCQYVRRCFICSSPEHHEALCSKNPIIIAEEFTEPCLSSGSKTTSSQSDCDSNCLQPPSVPRETFYDFVMNLQLPQPYVSWNI